MSFPATETGWRGDVGGGTEVRVRVERPAPRLGGAVNFAAVAAGLQVRPLHFWCSSGARAGSVSGSSSCSSCSSSTATTTVPGVTATPALFLELLEPLGDGGEGGEDC